VSAALNGRIVFLVGASGAGKTAAARFLGTRGPWAGHTHFFDSIGVPSPGEMDTEFGGPEAWQRWATERWVERLAARPEPLQLLEGQTRPSFVRSAAAAHPEVEVRIVLLDCSAETRARRLAGPRGQPELATGRMEGWAAYLRGQADALGLPVIETDGLTVEEVAARIETIALAVERDAP
jgi:hypothetical protein